MLRVARIRRARVRDEAKRLATLTQQALGLNDLDWMCSPASERYWRQYQVLIDARYGAKDAYYNAWRVIIAGQLSISLLEKGDRS